MTESFWLKDMIVFGQGAPNQISKIGGQQGRCFVSGLIKLVL